MKKSISIYKILIYALLILFLIACIYPLIWLILSSFKTQDELFINAWGIPMDFTLQNYFDAFTMGKINIYFKNSVFISIVSVCLAVILSTTASYGVTRLKWKLKGAALNFFLLGMMIPTYGSIIPLYSMFNKIHILNHYSAVIIPLVTFALPIGIFILTGFFSTIPKELEESAIIDGCSLPKAFLRVIAPLTKPGIVTVAVINFLSIWNDLLFSQVFLTSGEKMPLPAGLLEFKGRYGTNYVGMIAAVVITVIPVIIIYSFLHKKIIEGMISGAVKG